MLDLIIVRNQKNKEKNLHMIYLINSLFFLARIIDHHAKHRDGLFFNTKVLSD